jgi:hypothetical protein
MPQKGPAVLHESASRMQPRTIQTNAIPLAETKGLEFPSVHIVCNLAHWHMEMYLTRCSNMGEITFSWFSR